MFTHRGCVISGRMLSELAKIGNGRDMGCQILEEPPCSVISVLLDDKAGKACPRLIVS